jgi:hypothetical protein
MKSPPGVVLSHKPAAQLRDFKGEVLSCFAPYSKYQPKFPSHLQLLVRCPGSGGKGQFPF